MSIDSYFGISKPDEKKKIIVKPALADIVFEPRAVYEGQHKKLYTFDESLHELRKRGYERHPRPAEAFNLICRGLEGRLQPEQQAIADDVKNSYGEWLSMAMMREGNLLRCYLDPENLVWGKNERKYVVRGRKLKHAGEEVYSIGSLYWWVPIKDVNDANPTLVEKLWSRHYALLPEEIRQYGWLLLPPENVLWPVGHSNYDGWYGITYLCKASRGVRLSPTRKNHCGK